MDEKNKLANGTPQGTEGGNPELRDGQTATVDDVVSFVKNLCLTFSHLSYYPENHPLAINQMKIAWNELQPVFKKYGDLSISLNEGKLLFFGMPVEEQNPVVSKFSHHFEALHIHSIKFKAGITDREFVVFFKLFCQDHKMLEEQGGIEKLIKENDIQHITFNAAVYKVISEDEKVVKKSEVYRGESRDADGSKTELLNYFLGKMLDKSQDEKELLNEMKNDPEKLASQIVKIIEEIGGDGKYDKDSMVEALLQNIHMVSETFTKAGPATGEEQETVANAMILLENELYRKSKSLSSTSATRFVKRITDVVSSYTDKAKADKIFNEFLSHEKSLKSAENMMRELNVSGESGHNIIQKVRELIKEKGMQEDELIEILDKNVRNPEVKKKERTRKKRELSPIGDRIKNELNREFKDVKEKEKLIEYLDNVYNREIGRMVQDKTRELQHQVEEINGIVSDVKNLFENTNIGLVVVDHDGKVTLTEHADKLPYKMKNGDPLPDELILLLKDFKEHGALQIGNCTVWQVTLDEEKTVRSVLFQFTEA